MVGVLPNTPPQSEPEIPQEDIDFLRQTKVPCTKCKSTIVIFLEKKPRIEQATYQGVPVAVVYDLMKCLSCSSMYEQVYRT